tara:strand:+ start:448 stop:798 length:351 start_codon:yes stop_codon:yes gene_type:complete
MGILATIVHEQLYKYFAMGCATLFLIPQIRRGFITKSVKDVSTTSTIMIFMASILWGLYLKEENMYPYLAATIVVMISSGVLIFMSVKYYWDRVNNHMKSFDKPLNIRVTENDDQV